MKIFTIVQVLLLFELHIGHTLPHLQEIPDAPTLPDLDHNSLPEFVRKYLPTEKPVGIIEPNKDTARRRGNEKVNPRTYGMNIIYDHGYVWNDLVSPKTSYYVGENENAKLDPTKDIDDIIDDMIKNINNHPKTDKADEDSNKYDNPTTVELPKTTPKPESDLNGLSEQELLKEIDDKLDSIIQDVRKQIKIPQNITKSIKFLKDKDVKNNQGRDNGKNDKDESILGKDLGIKIKLSPNQQQPANLPSILKELVQNDELWQWLSTNVTKYLVILTNRIGAVIQEEVVMMLQSYFETHPCGSCESNASNSIHTIDVQDDIKPHSEEKIDAQKDTTKVDKVSDSYNKTNSIDDKLSKKRKDKHPEPDTVENNPEKEKVYEKTTIYGNSVGNERVTNVFIFRMNSDNNGKPTISTNNSSGSFTVDFDKNSSNNEADQNKDTTETKQVTTESTIEKEKDTLEIMETVTKDIGEDETSKKPTTDATTTEESFEDTKDKDDIDEKDDVAENEKESTKATTELETNTSEVDTSDDSIEENEVEE